VIAVIEDQKAWPNKNHFRMTYWWPRGMLRAESNRCSPMTGDIGNHGDSGDFL
jgi:hypothetical protein